MKKIAIFALVLAVLSTFSPLNVYASAPTIPDPDASTTGGDYSVASGSHSLDAVSSLLGSEKLVDNVRSAILYESNSQTLMYALNPDTQMFPASLVKLVTAMVAIEEGNLSDYVTVSDGAVADVPIDAVSAELKAGEKLTLEELLYCLIVGSANDAGAVIAEHIAGTQSAFVEKMNSYVQRVGCTATHFTNAHGLHDDNQHITARDAAKILDAALKNETFRAIFTTIDYTVPATNMSTERLLVNGVSMLDSDSKLYYDERVIGGRTGVTQDGRRCLATAAQSNGMLLICVVMGADSVYKEDGYSAVSIGGYQETTKLLDQCFNGYKTAQILFPGQIIRQIPVESANSDLFVSPSVSVTTVLPQNVTLQDLTFRYADKPLTLPIEKGQHVSDVQIWHGSMCVAQAELYAMNKVEDTSFRYVDTDNDGFGRFAWLWWIVGGVALIALVVVILRFRKRIRQILVSGRRKKYRRSRRRIR